MLYYVVVIITDILHHEGGIVLSEHFKTRKTYEAQPVIVNALLEVYVKHFRVGCDDDKDGLVFTTTLGTPMIQGYINTGNVSYYVMCAIIWACMIITVVLYDSFRRLF